MGFDFSNDGIENLSLTESEVYEAEALEPELYDIPDVGEVLVCGNPFDLDGKLDDTQGDNILNAQGDCGVVSVVNILRLAGIECSEDEAILNATRMRLCFYSTDCPAERNGGTNVFTRQELLEAYGVKAYVMNIKEPEYLAQLAEKGYGVNISVNSGYTWGIPEYIGDGSTNHSIIVTGSARDPETGELKGLFVCDSGLPGKTSSMFISVETLNKAYVNAYGSYALVTADPIRKI